MICDDSLAGSFLSDLGCVPLLGERDTVLVHLCEYWFYVLINNTLVIFH